MLLRLFKFCLSDVHKANNPAALIFYEHYSLRASRFVYKVLIVTARLLFSLASVYIVLLPDSALLTSSTSFSLVTIIS